MSTSISEIRKWVTEAPKGTSFVIIACDRFDHSDFPVYAGTPEKASSEIKRLNSADMTSVEEVYDLSMDLESQLSEPHAYHPPK